MVALLECRARMLFRAAARIIVMSLLAAAAAAGSRRKLGAAVVPENGIKQWQRKACRGAKAPDRHSTSPAAAFAPPNQVVLSVAGCQNQKMVRMLFSSAALV